MAVSVKVITDGPLMVKGECEMQDGQGNAMPPKGGDTIFLCRCGSSANKKVYTSRSISDLPGGRGTK